jgi:RNA polymerase sigma factor (sigma-70 family)
MLAKQEVTALSEVLRRVYARRVVDEHQLDDLVQETLARIVEARPQLGGQELIGYAIVTARNTLIDAARRQRDLTGGWPHGVVVVDDPATLAVQSEEAEAVRTALASLSEEDRRALVAHEVEGQTTGHLAAESGSTPGAIAARLARLRARARVDYVVALRNVSLPTERCHDVLVSLSSGLRRRQAEVGAADHLLTCETCAELAPPVVERRRSLAAILPFFGLPAVLGRARRAMARHPVLAGGAAAGAAAVVIAGVIGVAGMAGNADGGDGRSGGTEQAEPVADSTHESTSALETSPPAQTTASTAPPAAPPVQTPTPTTAPAPPPPPPPPPAGGSGCQVSDLAGTPLPNGGATDLVALAGTTVSVDGATVEAVPGDAGFWAACGPARLWIQVVGLPLGLPAAGQTIGAVGVVATHGPGYAASVGVTPAEGGGELDQAGVHVEATGVM